VFVERNTSTKYHKPNGKTEGLKKEIVMKSYKVMTRDNLTGEMTITNKAFSLDNAQTQMLAIVGRKLIEEGFDRSGKYSENGNVMSVSVEKLGPVGCGQIHSFDVTLLPQRRGQR
jgi:hypothetical protein